MTMLRASMALVVLAGGLTTATAGAQEQAAISAVLERRAAAVRAGDERAFRATMAGAPESFVRMRMRWFHGVRALDLGAYRIELDPDGPAAYPARPRDGFEETTIRGVLEHLEIAAYDRGAPQVLERFLTFGRRGAAWSVIADDELSDVGLDPPRDLWDLGEVRVQATDGVLVIARGSVARARTFAREIAAARDRVDRLWPFGAPDRIVALIPGSAADLVDLFAAEFDVERFVGFASSTWWRDDGEVELGGRRLVVNPQGFFGASPAARADILAHEVLHLAANPTTGWFVPAWLEEGAAMYFAERSPRSTAALRGRRVSLPDDHVFASGTDPQVATAYRASLSFVRFLARRHGRSAVARFQRTLGAISPVSAGTGDYHLDRVSRRVFGEGFPGLARTWQAEVRKGRT